MQTKYLHQGQCCLFLMTTAFILRLSLLIFQTSCFPSVAACLWLSRLLSPWVTAAWILQRVMNVLHAITAGSLSLVSQGRFNFHPGGCWSLLLVWVMSWHSLCSLIGQYIACLVCDWSILVTSSVSGSSSDHDANTCICSLSKILHQSIHVSENFISLNLILISCFPPSYRIWCPTCHV